MPPALQASTPRAVLLRRRTLRQAWLCVLVGVLIPFLALAGAVTGWRLTRRGDQAGLPLLVAGLVVFVARLTVFVAGGL